MQKTQMVVVDELMGMLNFECRRLDRAGDWLKTPCTWAGVLPSYMQINNTANHSASVVKPNKSTVLDLIFNFWPGRRRSSSKLSLMPMGEEGRARRDHAHRPHPKVNNFLVCIPRAHNANINDLASSIVLTTARGLREVEPDLLDLVRSIKGSRWQIFTKIQLPGALPYIFSGMKVAAVLAVAGAIVGEFLGSEKGLGYLGY